MGYAGVSMCARCADPYQFVAVAQRLSAHSLPMAEFAQSLPNLTHASLSLYALINGRNLAVYQDTEMRLAVSRCVALETSRGWRIVTLKVSHKIDVVVALAMAALDAVLNGQRRDYVMEYITRQLEKDRQVKEAGQLCAKPGCGKVLQPDVGISQARGLLFCSLACSW